MKQKMYTPGFDYLETPRKYATTVKLDTVLEERMKTFMLSRRRRWWLTFGK